MALAADRKNEIVAGGSSRYREHKCAGAVGKLYKGAAICRNLTGFAVTGANTVGFKMLGIAQEQVDTTGLADGAVRIKYLTGISVNFKNAAGGDAVTQARLGLPCFLHDDETVRGTPGNGVRAGIAEEINADGTIKVFVDAADVVDGEEINLEYDHAQVTADTTVKLYKVPAGKKFRLIGADYINPTGLVQDAANYFDIKVLKDATVMANWSTLTGAQGTIAADTFVALVNAAADADLVANAAAIIALFLDETGVATLPAGRIVIRGVLITA